MHFVLKYENDYWYFMKYTALHCVRIFHKLPSTFNWFDESDCFSKIERKLQ